MWETLDINNKNKYKKLITNFSSLSEAFSQKAEDDHTLITPIVNSKFQETVFQKSFGAVGEDIANTSYDASIRVDDNHKYLVGIKSFGFTSGDQKIAQFKRNSQQDNWGEILAEITKNAKETNSLKEANDKNYTLYVDLTKKIAKLRNDRIASSKAQIKGFCATDETVKAVYHVLMPSKSNETPQIFVGETSYSPIDIENINIIGATSLKNVTNFKFTDGNHIYKYTSADSQLLMNFNNKDIILEKWDVKYVDDPIEVFENLNANIRVEEHIDYEQSVSWIIHNKEGNVEENSGFNGFNGGSKLSKNNNNREKRISKLINKYKDKLDKQKLEYINLLLNKILLCTHTSKFEKQQMKDNRNELISFIEKIDNQELLYEIEQMVFRPLKEMYIPIPNSKNFHNLNPNFFGNQIGCFQTNSSKLFLPRKERRFRLEFISSGDSIEAYINQDFGKAIQSYGDQQVLGNWILKEVFQLKPREILTGTRLNELGINAIRLYKFKDRARGIGLEFTWIDPSNPPNDAIGWVSKNK